MLSNKLSTVDRLMDKKEDDPLIQRSLPATAAFGGISTEFYRRSTLNSGDNCRTSGQLLNDGGLFLF